MRPPLGRKSSELQELWERTGNETSRVNSSSVAGVHSGAVHVVHPWVGVGAGRVQA